MQVAIVGAGASVGKEGAPREVGALLAGRLAKGFSLALKERKVLIACGAGAGLAAVYQVPFASSLFVFETLGLAYSWQNLLLVLTSTYLATWVAQPIVGQEAIYHLSAVSWSASSFLQAIVIAFLVTPLALVFAFLAKRASHKRAKYGTILWALPLAFLVLGSLVAFFPIFMGNGQALLSSQPIPYLPLSLAVKGLLVYLLLRNGAYGGTLTPSFALGIGSGYLVTLLLTVLGIHLDPALGMLLGATVFLGTTLEAPLTAIALSLGFTGQTWNLTIPLVLAAGLSGEETMKVHLVLHETFEVPGAYLKWAQERGHQVTTTKVYENEALPETVDEIDFLIVMGGPQSPDEDREAFPYYDPQAEIEHQGRSLYCWGLPWCPAPVCCLWSEV